MIASCSGSSKEKVSSSELNNQSNSNSSSSSQTNSQNNTQEEIKQEIVETISTFENAKFDQAIFN